MTLSTNTYLILLFGMAAGTYLPRMLPLLLPGNAPLPPWVDRWLKLVPYAALGALIFPGILSVDPDRAWVGLVGGAAAVAVSLKWNNLVYTIVAAFAVAALLR
ncbi:MAG: AzlD domain-containing protein [Firmicutes bacterium]|nr:AzlD domain-containing protein [Bacillota bacterium]